MSDRPPGGAEWDGDNEKEKRDGYGQRKRRKDGTTIEIGCRDSENFSG